MDPIEGMTFVSGEDAVLSSPAATAKFDPSQTGDYQPNAPATLPIRGFQDHAVIEVVGATAVFTFPAKTKPVGLKAGASKLAWRGETWTVVQYQTRSWIGAINGFSLYLAT